MPRYDDRYSSTRLYVGRLSSRTRSRDLERLFSRYGRVRDVDMKRDYAFIDYSDPRDADDARYRLDGREFEGSRITVEFAKGTPRGSRDREYPSRGPPPGSGRCFNCGVDGHWARDCTAGDWKNKCYRCGERGHIERSCKNSPKKLSDSRSPVRSRSPRRRSRSPRRRSPSPRRRSPSPRRRSRSPRGRSRSRSHSYSSGRSYSRDRSYSRSRSPEQAVEPAERIRSPEMLNNSPPPKDREGSATPDDRSPLKRDSPEENERRSSSPARDGSPMRHEESPSDANGRDRSLSPQDDRSPRDDRSPVEDD